MSCFEIFFDSFSFNQHCLFRGLEIETVLDLDQEFDLIELKNGFMGNVVLGRKLFFFFFFSSQEVRFGFCEFKLGCRVFNELQLKWCVMDDRVNGDRVNGVSWMINLMHFQSFYFIIFGVDWRNRIQMADPDQSVEDAQLNPKFWDYCCILKEQNFIWNQAIQENCCYQ